MSLAEINRARNVHEASICVTHFRPTTGPADGNFDTQNFQHNGLGKQSKKIFKNNSLIIIIPKFGQNSHVYS